ncbi:MAG: SAM-dependent methyltransferase [Robiginitomaculum sp.]|nr:MAG: SAM-dependent methyltransferase [Robiginitomaculum sp.]
MSPYKIGTQYDLIATWWNERHSDSDYGVPQVEKALAFTKQGGKALDIGCGAGGRFIRKCEEHGLEVLGIDASAKMINLAKQNHPHLRFIHDDIRDWESEERFDFILAWDCLFHLPLKAQKPVLSKLCQMLTENGVLIHTFGDADGEHTDHWHNQKFTYSSIGISKNNQLLHENGLTPLHLELDQFPENHVFAISKKKHPQLPPRINSHAPREVVDNV